MNYLLTLSLCSRQYSLVCHCCSDVLPPVVANTFARVPEHELLFQIEKSLVQEEARYAQKENQELRQETQLLRLRNTELEGQVRPCTVY